MEQSAHTSEKLTWESLHEREVTCRSLNNNIGWVSLLGTPAFRSISRRARSYMDGLSLIRRNRPNQARSTVFFSISWLCTNIIISFILVFSTSFYILQATISLVTTVLIVLTSNLKAAFHLAFWLILLLSYFFQQKNFYLLSKTFFASW